MAMETRPKGKSFWMLSFAAQVARGVIKEARVRRITMFVIIALAIAMLVAGVTFLAETLDHHAQPIWFILYWLACGWLTVTALLLALFDLLILRMQARAARKAMNLEVELRRQNLRRDR
jgi:hypothetical protein